MSPANDTKLLCALGIDGMTPLTVKPLPSTHSISLGSAPLTPNKDVVSATSLFFANTTSNNNNSGNSSNSSTSMLFSSGATRTIDAEVERTLPSCLIARNPYAFDMLKRLEELDNERIGRRVRSLLKLMPTSPRLLDAFDTLVVAAASDTTLSDATTTTTTQPAHAMQRSATTAAAAVASASPLKTSASLARLVGRASVKHHFLICSAIKTALFLLHCIT